MVLVFTIPLQLYQAEGSLMHSKHLRKYGGDNYTSRCLEQSVAMSQYTQMSPNYNTHITVNYKCGLSCHISQAACFAHFPEVREKVTFCGGPDINNFKRAFTVESFAYFLNRDVNSMPSKVFSTIVKALLCVYHEVLELDGEGCTGVGYIRVLPKNLTVNELVNLLSTLRVLREGGSSLNFVVAAVERYGSILRPIDVVVLLNMGGMLYRDGVAWNLHVHTLNGHGFVGMESSPLYTVNTLVKLRYNTYSVRRGLRENGERLAIDGDLTYTAISMPVDYDLMGDYNKGIIPFGGNSYYHLITNLDENKLEDCVNLGLEIADGCIKYMDNLHGAIADIKKKINEGDEAYENINLRL